MSDTDNKIAEFARNPQFVAEMRTSSARRRVTPDKWAPYDALRNPKACDRYAREVLGVELHSGSTAEEIQWVVRLYKASW
jgi:hypothetical protein